MTTKKKAVKTPAKLPGNIEALWGEKRNPSRGPKPTLSVDQIARAAVRVADSEGLEAVSIQRVAREVHVTTMALYRYFSSKAELVDLMIDTMPPPDLGAVSTGWRSRLKEWTVRCSSIYTEHPWFLQAVSARPRIMGPNELGWLNAALAVLADTGLPPRDRHQAFLVLIGHVRSNAEFMASRARRASAEQWVKITAKLLGRHRDRYPALMAAIESGAFSLAPEDGLEFGLECILDGIESLVGKRREQS